MGDGSRTNGTSSKKDNDITHKEVMLAGAFAAFTVDLLVYPLDTIKTRMQSRDYIKTYADMSASSPPKATATAAAAALQRTAVPSAYALRGLYQGIGTVILATLPASGVFFTTYEWAKTIVGHALPTVTGSPAPPALVHALSSGMAELASCLVLTPAEVIKQNAQMIRKSAGESGTTGTTKKTAKTAKSMSTASTSLQALRMLANAEGGAIRRLLSGYTALAARNLPFTAMQFPMFEALRVRLRQRWDSRQGASTHHAHPLLVVGAVNGLSAGTSGSVAAVITTPFDVVKTRMMLGVDMERTVESESESKSKNKPRRPNALRLARIVYDEHGVRGLFRGGAFRAGWTFVGSGLYLGTYEVAKAWLRDDNGEGVGEQLCSAMQ
ncbi:hypothetical protein SCUCBS95973_003830 [Sporothrix curviconia]|uniref:Mitochondrial carrier protein n=1 Tax=Sporothrix curviconia TaxID=1260050 RepID=A0ABP0BJR4_9PEZI